MLLTGAALLDTSRTNLDLAGSSRRVGAHYLHNRLATCERRGGVVNERRLAFLVRQMDPEGFDEWASPFGWWNLIAAGYLRALILYLEDNEPDVARALLDGPVES